MEINHIRSVQDLLNDPYASDFISGIKEGGQKLAAAEKAEGAPPNPDGSTPDPNTSGN